LPGERAPVRACPRARSRLERVEERSTVVPRLAQHPQQDVGWPITTGGRAWRIFEHVDGVGEARRRRDVRALPPDRYSV